MKPFSFWVSWLEITRRQWNKIFKMLGCLGKTPSFMMMAEVWLLRRMDQESNQSDSNLPLPQRLKEELELIQLSVASLSQRESSKTKITSRNSSERKAKPFRILRQDLSKILCQVLSTKQKMRSLRESFTLWIWWRRYFKATSVWGRTFKSKGRTLTTLMLTSLCSRMRMRIWGLAFKYSKNTRARTPT